MKKVSLFLATAIMIAFAASCQKSETPSTPKDDEKEQEQDTTPASTACLITAFSVTSGNVTIEGQIFNEENYIELTYEPEQQVALANAKATVTISDKATIAPDPATISDWTNEVKFTVTAEDGKTKKEYSVKPAPVSYIVSIAVGSGDGKTLSEIGGGADIALFAGNQIAFCSTENIVMSDGRVYDLDMNYVGDLSRGEIPEGCAFTSLGNDDNGVLVAAVGYGSSSYSTPNADESGTPVWGYTNATRIYAWKDGWDKAPTKIYEEASFLAWMNVSGDVTGKMLITAKQNTNEGKHEMLSFDNGVLDGTAAVFETGIKEIDRDRNDIPEYAPEDGMNYVPANWRMGQTAGSTLAPLGTTKDNALFVYGQSLSGLQEEDPNGWTWNGEKYVHDVWGKDGNAGMKVALRHGYNGADMILRGTAATINGGTARYGGLYGWGNVCLTGNIKLFNYGGTIYAAVSGQDWNEAHLTIVDVTSSTEAETKYLLETQGEARNSVNALASVAYVFNPKTQNGEVVALHAMSDAEEFDSFVRRYTLTRRAK